MKRRDFLIAGLSLGLSNEAYGLTSQKLHDFKLEDVNPNSETYQSQLGPQDYRKGLLLLNFAAPWCKYCREEFPHFQEQYNKGGVDILVVGIDDDKPWSEMEEFKNYTYPFLFHGKIAREKGSDVAAKYGISSIPVTYFVKDSEIKKIKDGVLTKKELDDLVKEFK